MSNLRLRVISGVIMAAIFLAAVYAGGFIFTVLMGAVAFAIWAEWCDITQYDGDDRLRLAGFVAIGLSTLALVAGCGAWSLAALVLIAAVFGGYALSFHGGGNAVGGFAYAVGLLAGASLLRGNHHDSAGLVAIIFLCAVVWGTDIGAYFTGRSLGGPKLAPRISPNKTISGALGGIAVAVIGAMIVFRSAGLMPLSLAAMLAIVLSVLSQIGDLFESWLKRRAGIKDSGHLIPGHGGAMDRVDGLVFATIALWIASMLASEIARPSLAFFG